MSPEKEQIYIVDDDESVRRALGILLETYGYKVKLFASAEEFFTVVSEKDPGLLILDIHMPGMNGWATLKRLFDAGTKRRIIVITADKNGGLKERVLETGVEAFFRKPINDDDLINAISPPKGAQRPQLST